MIVSEKGLIRAMKEAYKNGSGYNVAVEADPAGVTNVIIGTSWWTVVIEKGELPRKVLGMIAEHLGEIPKAGEAYRITKGEPQTEIFGVAAKGLRSVHDDNPPLQLIKRTDLTMGGYPLWQRIDDGKMYRICPDYEDILLLDKGTVRIVQKVLMLDDMVSRAYVAAEPEDPERMEQMVHLGKVSW